MCDVSHCNQPGTILVEPGHILCEEHGNPIRKYVCKHCKVPMVSKTDHRPILGYSHKKNCPRRRIMG